VVIRQTWLKNTPRLIPLCVQWVASPRVFTYTSVMAQEFRFPETSYTWAASGAPTGRDVPRSALKTWHGVNVASLIVADETHTKDMKICYDLT